MRSFYRLNGTTAEIGSGSIIHDGYTEYIVGQEPQELKDAMTVQAQIELEAQAKQKAKQFLQSTDFKMTVDYFATMSEDQKINLTNLRKEARLVLEY